MAHSAQNTVQYLIDLVEKPELISMAGHANRSNVFLLLTACP